MSRVELGVRVGTGVRFVGVPVGVAPGAWGVEPV